MDWNVSNGPNTWYFQTMADGARDAALSAETPWQVRRGMFATRLTVEVAGEHGMTVADCLAGTGLVGDQLHDPTTLVDVAQELTVARNLQRHLGHGPEVPLAIGLRVNLGNLGILGFAFLSSPTVRDAVRVMLRYAALTPTFLSLTLEEGPDWTVLRADHREIPADVREFFLLRDVAAMGTVVPRVLGQFRSVRLELPIAPARAGSLADALPVEGVTFDSPTVAVSFPSTLLNEPLPNADDDAARMSLQQCQDLLEQRLIRHGIDEQVRATILRDLAGPPSMIAIADELHVAPRTLHRRLKLEGTTFRALLDEVRETLAVELLTNVGLSVEEVALRLGYAETANFTHAFKRWRGQPPSALRQRQFKRPMP